jgi:hypothetical protein
MLRRAIFVLGALLAGCVGTYPVEFVTNQEVPLRRLEAADSAVIAVLPKGTPVVPIGPVGSNCVCWKVATYAGAGWLYTRFVDGPGPSAGAGVTPPPATAASVVHVP